VGDGVRAASAVVPFDAVVFVRSGAFGVLLGLPDMTIAIDAALFFGAMSALYLGLGTLWAAWSTHRGRRAWAADPIGFLEARAGRSIDAAVDVRQVAVVGAVGILNGLAARGSCSPSLLTCSWLNQWFRGRSTARRSFIPVAKVH